MGKLRLLKIALAATTLAATMAIANAGNLKIESWRNDDADIWNSKIIPAFNKAHPDIKVESFKAANTFYMGMNLGYEPLAMGFAPATWAGSTRRATSSSPIV